MLSHGLVGLTLLALLPIAIAQCLTDQNPYCAGNAKFEQICCQYPDVCYWADRAGTPACCPAGEVCLDRDGITVHPQPIYTTIQPTPTPVQPTTIYTTIIPPQTQTITYTQPTQQQPTQPPTQQPNCCITTITQPQPQPQPTQSPQPTVVITTTNPGVVDGIGSTIAATASSAIVIFQGFAPAARPARCAFPIAGAIVAALWHVA